MGALLQKPLLRDNMMSASTLGRKRELSTEALTQRVGVFVDNSSLYRALSGRKQGEKVNYDDLLTALVEGRNLVQARFYCSEFGRDLVQKSGFYRALERLGYQVRRTKIKGHRSSKRNAAFDSVLSRAIHSAIAWDMCESGHECDVFVLVSGSTEYTDIAQKAVERGIEVEVVFFAEVTSHVLVDNATRFREISYFCALE